MSTKKKYNRYDILFQPKKKKTWLLLKPKPINMDREKDLKNRKRQKKWGKNNIPRKDTRMVILDYLSYITDTIILIKLKFNRKTLCRKTIEYHKLLKLMKVLVAWTTTKLYSIRWGRLHGSKYDWSIINFIWIQLINL